MKKIAILVALTYGAFLILILLLLFPASAGDMDSSSKIVATEDQAYNYQYIASELGVPWDIVLLCDAILAQQDKLSDIEDFNPLVTALEFCILQEDIYTLQPVYSPDFVTILGYERVVVETILYTGCDEILSYIGRTRDEISVKDVTDIVVEINQTAEEKCTDELKYDVTLLSNLDYEYVLRELIGLKEGDIKGIMELYHAQYMAELYGYMPEEEDFTAIHVPPVPSGSITRYDLARIAVSLINWPYQLGSKSPYQGTPRVPLDCSGYVDWVYIQCFGIGVSAGGRVPAGVAVSGTAIQYYASDPISESELKIGDLGFIKEPRNVRPGEYNHVGIYIGEISGRQAWIHCAGKSYGYAERPNGRVGISLRSGSNSYDPITGTSFEPAMKSINFQYFRRPRFEFADDVQDTENE